MTMNKYELALVINAKIEDDARTDAIEKIKALIENSFLQAFLEPLLLFHTSYIAAENPFQL